MDFETLKWIGDTKGSLELTDQRLLPGQYKKLRCETIEQLYDAIKTLAVRGAPAIGVAAGYGICLAMQSFGGNELKNAVSHLEKNADYLAGSRPTAVNLFWALERMKTSAKKFITENAGASVAELCHALLSEAHAVCKEDRDMCKAIGVNGQQYIKNDSGILTHCNAGALATAGQGTEIGRASCRERV